MTLEQRKDVLKAAAEQRFAEFTGAKPGLLAARRRRSTATRRRSSVSFTISTARRGALTRAPTTQPTLSSNVAFMNFYPFAQIETISPRPVLFIAGDQAHSIEFSQDAYKRAAEPKELFLVPGAGHVDLYDRVNLIPFDKLTDFPGQSQLVSQSKTSFPPPVEEELHTDHLFVTEDHHGRSPQWPV